MAKPQPKAKKPKIIEVTPMSNALNGDAHFRCMIPQTQTQP
jgi:hypothetical protein